MWFWPKLTIRTEPVMPTATASPVPSPVEAAHAEVLRLKRELSQLDDEMRHFKTTNRLVTSKYGVIVRCWCSFRERGRIESQWRELLKRRDALVSRWHQALHQWAFEKERAKETA